MNKNSVPGRVVLAIALWSCVVLVSAGTAAAAGYRSVETASPQETVDAIATKATRGVANVATGWLEFPKQIYVTFKEDGPAKGIFVGPLKGMGMAVIRTVVGALEIATFPVPYPGYYEPYFEPAYVWQKE